MSPNPHDLKDFGVSVVCGPTGMIIVNDSSQIDLFDGDQIIDKLKELRLGVNVEMVESVNIHTGWFASI